MQVRQTVLVGGVDNHRVHIRNIHARLDDGGGEEDVVVVVDEVFQPFLHLLARHLSVRRDDTRLGAERAYLALDTRQHLDTVIHDEYLSVALHFQRDGFFDDVLVGLRDEFGLHGVAVLRRRGHHAQVACTEQRELQGARDGGCRQRQHIHIGAQRLQFLLHRHAKLLLLINDEQPEVVPFHALAHQFVRTYQDVYLPFFEGLQYLFHLLGGFCPRQVFDAHGEVFHALSEGVVMLQGEHRGRH